VGYNSIAIFIHLAVVASATFGENSDL